MIAIAIKNPKNKIKAKMERANKKKRAIKTSPLLKVMQALSKLLNKQQIVRHWKPVNKV